MRRSPSLIPLLPRCTTIGLSLWLWGGNCTGLPIVRVLGGTVGYLPGMAQTNAPDLTNSRVVTKSIEVEPINLTHHQPDRLTQNTPTNPSPNTLNTLCPTAALQRLQQHTVTTGETLATIADRYQLAPFTLQAFNPVLAQRAPAVGDQLQIPPYNGLRVTVRSGETWRELADRYQIRADTLFEVNGCLANPPIEVFIPGAVATPNPASLPTSPASSAENPTATRGADAIDPDATITTYPLAQPGDILVRYGWVLLPGQESVVFHSGVDLQAEPGTIVQASGAGTVAFVGDREPYGNLVVINHPQGLQTRYAHLDQIQVQVGQTVRAGTAIATVGTTGSPDVDRVHLHFEIRQNSPDGWVALNPAAYLEIILGIPRSQESPRA